MTSERKAGERSPLFFKTLDLIMVGAFHASRKMVQLMPPRLVYDLASAIGLAGLLARPRARRKLLATIGEVFPGISRQKAARIALGSASMFFKPMPAFFLFGRYKERCMAELEVEGLHHLEEADARGKGVLILCTHVGPFVLTEPTMCSLGYAYTPVTYKADSTPLPRYLSALHNYAAGLGVDPELPVIFPGDDASRQITGHLAKGRRVGITIDAPGTSVLDFFDRPASLGTGMAHFARVTGAAILPVVLLDRGGGIKRRLIVYPPLVYELTGDKQADTAAIMREVVAAGERQIREAPGQWLSWFGLRGMWERGEQLVSERENKEAETR